MKMIGAELAQAINEQIGNEYGAMMQYLQIAAYFEQENLELLAHLFFDQAEEEKEHAQKLLHYLVETGAELRIPAISAPSYDFRSAEAAVQAALNWEEEVTGQINNLMRIAIAQNDYLGQSFLKWFVDEQLEEIAKMEQLLSVVKRSGEKNLLMVEAYLVHIQKAE